MVLESNTLDLLFVKDGEQGTDGKMLYTWIKYAKDDKGTDMTDDPQSAVYIGISYNNESNVESDDPTQYAWTKIQGADGKKGEDAYTIVLENENISFATDENRNPLSEQAYTSRITVMKGATPVTDFGIGDIAKTQGIAIAKGDDGISISVVNGNALPADSGEITVPISVGGTVFKKVLTWTCAKKGEQGVKGDKGDTGQKGQDGTSVKITSKSVTYQTSTSGTTAPTGTWSTTVPTVNNGQYLWTKTTVQYSDGNKTEAYSVSYKGTNGTNGTSVTVSKTEITYQVSTSGTTAPTGTWSTTMPSCDQGQYLWTKTYVKYSDGKDTTSYSVSYKGVDGEKFAFNMLRETNQGSKHWENHASGGKYSTESIITEDGINAVKLICTEAIPSGGWQYVSFGDYQMLKSLKPSTDYVISFDIKSNLGTQGSWVSIQQGDSTNAMLPAAMTHIKGNETWEHIRVFLRSNDTLPKINGQYIYITSLGGVGYSIIKNLKLTEGIVDTPWAPHPEDLEGRGVTEITQWYLATNLSSGVTAGTSGWSTDITTQKITADKKYLWNCHRTKYSDGTMTLISTPAIIGVYGEKGDNAKNLSITPSSQYFKSTDGGKTFAPNQITITPTIQGEINFGKWQYSIDGGVSFADAVSGQKGLTISNNVLTVNKDSSLYSDAVTMVTFRAVASDSSFYDTCSIAKIYDVSDIGDGRNLWITRDNITLQACEKDKYIYTTTGTSAICIGADVNSVGTNTIALQTGTKYTISFVISSPSEVGYAQWYFCTALNGTAVKNYGGYAVKLVAGENIVSQTITVDTSCDAAGLVIYNLPTGCIIKDIQVEKGSSPTGWSPAPEDIQTAILSTKSEISDVSLKVDNNKQAIEQRVEKTTYERELTLVKGDISKANEGLNKWRYEIYPKSLFTDKPEDQNKYDIGVFIRNKNLTPSRTLVFDDNKWTLLDYENNYIGYGLTFVKMSAKKTFSTKWAHSSSCSIYVNGKLIISDEGTVRLDSNNTGRDFSCTFIEGWNCIEFVMQETTGNEWFFFKDAISAISECQLMNCYYGTPVARQSHITNQLVENTTNIKGISTKVSKVTSVIGDNGENFTSFQNDYSDFKQTMNGFKTTVGQTYVTKDDFNGLEIGGRNLLLYSQTIRAHKDYYGVGWLTDEVETFNGCPVWSVKNQWGRLTWLFKSHVIDRGLVKVGDTLTYSLYAKTNNASGKSINCSYRFKGNANAYWFNGSAFNVGTNWTRYSVTFTITKDMLATDTYMNAIGFEETASMSGDDKVYYACPKLERGTKATDYTEAPEDGEINGQNLVSNLPSNWEQGSFQDSKTNVGCDYDTNKSFMTTRIRIKELVPVSGTITISNAYSNQSKKPIQHWITAFDVNKKWLGSSYVSTAWSDFPRTVDMNGAKYIAVFVKYKDDSAITPSDISKICLKIERGTSATPFTLAPEDVNGKIQSVETIATQTADKFSWLVKSGTSSSNFELTDKTATLVADKINMDGLVTFNGLDSSARDRINTVTSGNLITVTPANPKSDYGGGQTYNVIADDKGGRCVQWNSSCASFLLLNSYTPINFTSSDQLYYDIRVPNWSSTTFDTKLTIWFYNKNKALITSASKTLTLKSTIWNHFTGYLTLPSSSNWGDLYYYIIGLTNPNKQAIGFTNDSYIEKVNSYATAYAKNAVDWVGQNGTNTNNMYNMVSKWTDGAVSDTTQINGGWIKTNTITANKIAIGDFTNYADINESNTYRFRAEQTKEGTWFYRDGSELQRDNVISELHTCRGGEKFYVEYDISNTIKEGDEYKYAGLMIFGYDGNGGIVSYNRNAGVTATANGEITHITTQLTMPDTTRSFRVYLQIEGHVPFTGTLKIRNISVRKAVTGNLIVDGAITADKIATDAIKSRNYISSGGTQGSFLNLSDGSFKSPNLSWDSNGNLIAKNANLSGEITAKDGTIGKYKITDQWLITGSGSTCTGIGGNQAFWAGAEDSNSAPFRVNYDGSMISTKGKIGDWKIDKMGLYNDFIVTFGVDQSDGTWLETFYTNYSAKTLYKANAFNNIFLGNKICCMDTHTEYTYLNDNSNKGDITYVESVILENGRINLHSSQYSDSRFALIPYDNYGSHLTLSGEAIEFSSYEADGTYSERNVDAKYTYTYISSDTIKTADVYCSNILRTNNLLVYEIISGRDIHLTSSANQIQLNASNQGSIELYGQTPFIDFHYNYSGDDYTSRIIANGSNLLSITGNLWVDVDIHAGSWLYASEVHTSGAVVIASDSESFYWAHGYQIARGTSWGGVCVGDDSQQLRLYGSSIWAAHGISTSDENLKENFTTLDQYEDFYMNLNPIGFNYIGDYDGKKTHFGFGAHKTEDILESEGYDSDKFAVVTHRPLVQEDIEKRFGKDIDVDIETEYGVSYTEFIALNTHMIQKTRRELTKVKQEKADLEARLQAIEAKLGL